VARPHAHDDCGFGDEIEVVPILILCIVVLVCVLVRPIGVAAADAARAIASDVHLLLAMICALVAAAAAFVMVWAVCDAVSASFVWGPVKPTGGCAAPALLQVCGVLAALALFTGFACAFSQYQAYSHIAQLPPPERAFAMHGQ
jgi:hypothetical protein